MQNKAILKIILWGFFLVSPAAFALEGQSFLSKLMEPEKVRVSPFASVIIDPMCESPVESFDIPNQLLTIAKISASIAFAGGDYHVGLKAAKTMNWLPVDTEVMLGEEMHELNRERIIRRGSKNKRYVRLYAKVDNVLEDIIDSLPKALPFDLKLFITTDQGINASAQAGGFIYLTKEAAEKGDDFLAVLLAHEVFHVAQRHTTRQYQATLIDVIDSVNRFKSLLSSSGSVKEVASLGFLTATVLTSYDVKQEEQADICAGRLVSGMAGYNASSGVNSFLEVSANREKSDIPMFSNHPAPKKRRKVFSLAINKPMKIKAGFRRKVHLVNKASTDVYRLLNKASVQFSANKLTSPEGDSAYETYRSILEREPNNVRALKGVNDIAGRYVVWSSSSLAKGEVDKARNYLAKAKYVDASHLGIKALNKKLSGGSKSLVLAGEKFGGMLESLTHSIGMGVGGFLK